MAIMGGGESRPDRVRGEVGAEVGTHGALGVFGTALVPLGDNGAAVISFSRSRLGDAGRPRR